EPARDRDIVARKASRVARAVPLLVVRPRDVPGQREEGGGRAEVPLGREYGVAPEGRVRLHYLELLRVELARLLQDPVRDPYLPYVVQRGRLVEQLDRPGRQLPLEPRMLLHHFRQELDVVLGAAYMVAGLVVAGLRERAQGDHRHILYRPDLLGPPHDLRLEVRVLVLQKIPDPLEAEVRTDPRQHYGRARRLGDVVLRAELEPLLLVDLLRFRRQEDHGNARGAGIFLESSAGLVAAHAGHHDIEEDEVGRVLA